MTTLASHNLSDEAIVDRIVNGEKHLYEILMRKFNERFYPDQHVYNRRW